jgi:5'(3')-deoxyribonucleotidase
MKCNQPLTIAIDVDGVLLDLVTPWLERLHARTGYKIYYEDVKTFNIETLLPEYLRSTFTSFLDDTIYDYVQPVLDAPWGVMELAKMGHSLILVTHCHPDRIASKMRAIRRFFPEVFSGVVVTKWKDCVNYDILIDDAIHNNPTILLNQPWNLGWDANEFSQRALSWNHIVSLMSDWGRW